MNKKQMEQWQPWIDFSKNPKNILYLKKAINDCETSELAQLLGVIYSAIKWMPSNEFMHSPSSCGLCISNRGVCADCILGEITGMTVKSSLFAEPISKLCKEICDVYDRKYKSLHKEQDAKKRTANKTLELVLKAYGKLYNEYYK